MRVGGGPAGRERRWGFAPGGSYAAGTPLRAGKDVPNVVSVAATFPAGPRPATVRLGVATGAWRTGATHTGPGGSSHGGSDLAVPFGKARAVGGGTGLSVAHDVRARAYRVVAVDGDGVEHTGGVSSMGGEWYERRPAGG